MTSQKDCTVTEQLYEFILEKGLNGLVPAVQLLLNEAMKLERSKYLGGLPYERFSEREDYANGYKDKKLQLKLGEVDLKIPQVREGDFYLSMLEKGMRSERALKLAIAEMYVQGVSTRKMMGIMERLSGYEISSTDVSRASKLLDEELEKWRNRSLGSYPYIYFDARYEKVRMNSEVRDASILIATGVSESGKREILGLLGTNFFIKIKSCKFLILLDPRLRGDDKMGSSQQSHIGCFCSLIGGGKTLAPIYGKFAESRIAGNSADYQ